MVNAFVDPRREFFFALVLASNQFVNQPQRIMSDLTQHRFGLALGFFEQTPRRAHVGTVSGLRAAGRSGAELPAATIARAV